MHAIAAVVLGFLFIFLFDVMLLKKTAVVKFIPWVTGLSLLAYALIQAAHDSYKLPIPKWTLWPGWVAFTISLVLIIYSLFINLPFNNTYVSNKPDNHLITTGFYMLCRHPGTYWVNLLVVSLVFISRSGLQLVTALLFIVLNTTLVIIEDRYIFPRIFPDYHIYQKETPMLIPDGKSIRKFLSTQRR